MASFVNILVFFNLFCLGYLAVASDVLEFTDNNFDDRIKEHDVILVEFYAPWCGHCKKLAPEYEAAATVLQREDPPVPLAKVDCIAEKNTCEKFGVSGYPTLKVFKSGEFAFEYQGPRDSDGIVKYMRSKSGPATRELTSKDDLTRLLDRGDAMAIGYFESKSDKLATAFMKLADKESENFKFAHTFGSDVAESAGYKNTVVLYRAKAMKNTFEPDALQYSGAENVDDMQRWLKNNKNGLVPLRTMGNAAEMLQPLVVAYYEVDYEKNAKGTNYWRNRVLKVAKKLSEEGVSVYFAVSSSKDFSHEMQEFGDDFHLGAEAKPVVAGRDQAGRKYKMAGEFSPEHVEKFARQLVAGELEAYLKSEPIPESNDEPVKVVVAKTFDEIVNDPTKDVLVEFYAPWCGHCKSLAPKYDELAKKLRKEPDVVIAKMDATANDVPAPYEVRGFPTIFFAPKNGKKSPSSYQGGREVNDFIKYLAEHSTSPLHGFDRSGNKKKSDEL